MAMKTPQFFDFRQNMRRNSFEVFYYKEPKAANVEVHHHDFYEVYYLIAGEVSYWVDGQTYHLRPGDLLLINPMELHRPVVKSNSRYERFVLWINKSYLESLSPDGTLTLCFHGGANHMRGSTISSLLSDLVTEHYSDNYASNIYAEGLFLQFMVELNRLSPVTAQPPSRSNLISQILAYIGQHYSEKITLDSLSAQFHINKYHLSHAFKNETGTSLYHYITLKRLAAARQMLNDGLAPGDVCTSCGFSDYTAFYKAFKAEYGAAPTMIGKK